MLVLIIYTFTISVYNASTAVKDTLNMAPIAIVDEDHSTLSERISSAFIRLILSVKPPRLARWMQAWTQGIYLCGQYSE